MGGSSEPSRIARRIDTRLALVGIVAALAVACGGGASPRPTDPRQILTTAIAATAAVPTIRLHMELQTSFNGGVGAPGGQMTMAMDANIDVAGRQLTGKATTRMPAGVINGGGGAPAVQTSEV